MNTKIFIAMLLAIALVCGCDPEQKPAKSNNNESHGHDHGQGKHGGEILDSGAGVHVEFIHDEHEGNLSLYILGADAQTVTSPAAPPIVKLRTADGPKQITTQLTKDKKGISFYQASDKALRGSFDGRISLTVDGKNYNIDIESHGHDHDEHGHGHGEHGHDDHGHGHEHGHGERSISHTAWTEKCEWFVELEMPEVGKAAQFAAHVTLLADFSPATTGSFTAEASSRGKKTQTSAQKPARDGIFTPSITFPHAGQWQLRLIYTNGDFRDAIEYQIEVYEQDNLPAEEEETDEAVSFLKEQQWKIDFATEWTTQRVIAGQKALAVPESAIFEKDGQSFACVQLDGESFSLRPLQLGERENGWIAVKGGLQLRERLVVKGGDKVRK